MAGVRDAGHMYGGTSSSLTDIKIKPDHERIATIDRDSPVPNKRPRSSRDVAAMKRRCVSTACVACRKRKSKCDGNTPSCAACSSVYGTECVYDPLSDHRRKGVYKDKIDSLKTRNSTLQTLIQAILNAAEEDVPDLVRQIRTCESLDDVAENILKQEQALEEGDDDIYDNTSYTTTNLPNFESQLSGKMGELRLENGSVRFLGGTSNLIYLDAADVEDGDALETTQQDEPLLSWTTVTNDTEVIVHLINMYFTWHYPYFTTLSKSLFYQDFLLGKPPGNPKRTMHCSSLLVSEDSTLYSNIFSLLQVNAMLALGCHFTNSPQACADPGDTATKGDHYFAEAKRLIFENDEYEKPRLTTIQALCLMSVREAGGGREGKGWVYSGMAFRMAQDMGLHLDPGISKSNTNDCPIDEKEIDVRRVTFWGCFLFDKCFSNYLGRLPQLSVTEITVPKYDVKKFDDDEIWSPYTDNGIGQLHSQPSRTRAVALQISSLCEISSDLLTFFYHPQRVERGVGRSQELKKLSELQTRLEAWKRDLPKEFEAKEGQLPNVLLMHYPTDSKVPPTNNLMNDISTESSLTGIHSTVSVQRDHPDPISYSTQVSPVSAYHPSHTMYPHQAQSFGPSIANGASRSNISPLTSGNRHVSPSTMFGGVEQLVQSQDWWLQDQVSLAVGFENWMGGGIGLEW
ncbi:hypothetical protein SS1G_08630 [Sclerotinia sclerotiorum 1980 UF-70]|uniref:Zn(2)-C6 fungal-type domain-containing protein n=1 Tax=Sclerotinia sclerotiorum (strain ATCC 18683 / 1980 / Ss-1) TaxID=665079 RepID=A7ETH4_SCLS1|nr:hypothetical protein SS1G_08630 [Sclerotinia sclerotiorum 1980 UF-70]EDN92766.1 hypothetical protein SS1G_08630 [Sclerotinia sclerotiorum 1980 UF-70]